MKETATFCANGEFRNKAAQCVYHFIGFIFHAEFIWPVAFWQIDPWWKGRLYFFKRKLGKRGATRGRCWKPALVVEPPFMKEASPGEWLLENRCVCERLWPHWTHAQGPAYWTQRLLKWEHIRNAVTARRLREVQMFVQGLSGKQDEMQT